MPGSLDASLADFETDEEDGREDEHDEGQDSMKEYTGGSTLVRMDWQVTRSAIGRSLLRVEWPRLFV